jgi:hypothetical protein
MSDDIAYCPKCGQPYPYNQEGQARHQRMCMAQVKWGAYTQVGFKQGNKGKGKRK